MKGFVVKIEPIMKVTISIADGNMVGSVLSDFSARGGIVKEIAGDDGKTARVLGNVPLSKILGYANQLRSLTKGEGAFNSELIGYAKKA